MEIATLNTKYLTRSPLKVKVIRADSPCSGYNLITAKKISRIWWKISPAEWRDEVGFYISHPSLRCSLRRYGYRPRGTKIASRYRTPDSRRQYGLNQSKRLGPSCGTSYSEIYILEDRFCELEWQAIPCALAHIGPFQLRNTWPRRARELIKFFIDRREAWINIIGDVEDEAAIVNLEIRTEYGTEMKNIKDILVDLGHA